MKLFISYFLKCRFWGSVFLFAEIILLCILKLNNVPTFEILYGICIELFILVIAVIYDYYKYYEKYKNLRNVYNNINISAEGMPQPSDCIEEEYQLIIRRILSIYNDIKDEKYNAYKDMEEYYTTWVHQIKTPIAAMKLLLQDKSNDIDMSDEYAQLFSIEQYVGMALSYMRFNSENTDFVIKRVDVYKVVKDAIHKYARLFIGKKLKLDFDEFSMNVISDEKWLQFVIEQILSNAIKYTRTGGITIYHENDLDSNLPDDDNDETHRQVLVIEDTGIGINRADLPRICEKGYTGYNGHDDKLSTGIGLYLSSRILKKLSHSLIIESEQGKGTKVKIIFIQK